VLRSKGSANVLRERIHAHLASERYSELTDIRIVREPTDINPAMPRFVTAFLASRFAGG
jgi:hypothetical protein